MSTTAPFARFEWMIAWRYLRARRAEIDRALRLGRRREGLHAEERGREMKRVAGKRWPRSLGPPKVQK